MWIYMILFDIIGNLSTQVFDRLTVVFTMQSFTCEIIKHPSIIRIKNYRVHQTGKKPPWWYDEERPEDNTYGQYQGKFNNF